jgi:hypothetical protein
MKEIKEKRQYVGDIIYKKGETSESKPNGHSAYFYTKTQFLGAITLGVG